MLKKITYIVVLLFIVGLSFGSWFWFTKIDKNTQNLTTKTVLIKTGSSYQEVLTELEKQGVLSNSNSIEWLSQKMNYPNKVKSGKYKIDPQITYRELITKLRSGSQVPVKLTFNNVRLPEDLAGKLAKQLELDSLTILTELNKKPESFLYFIPNTYEVYWNWSFNKIKNKVKANYDNFWNTNRIAKAKQIGLTTKEVAVLASIVQSETKKNDEKPRVAGVYANRLKIKEPLGADPTLVFAHKDFTIKRVLNIHKQIDSPYNTYKYRGLPPGPICLPSISSLNAVLNYENHDYLFFCAREDFSGYHNFAKTNRQHERNAARYHKALNDRKIYR